MDAIILFRKQHLQGVQKALMASGYGKGRVQDESSMSIQLYVSHDQLCTKKELQEHLRSELKDPTIIVR